jgi:hypothetical protein
VDTRSRFVTNTSVTLSYSSHTLNTSLHTIASTVLVQHPLHWAKEQRGGAARKKEQMPLVRGEKIVGSEQM